MHDGQFDRHSQEHQAIWRLGALQPSPTLAQEWDGPDCIALLQECNNQSWTSNFAHIATLFGITALTDAISDPDPELIVKLLLNCPQVVDMALENFCADGECIDGLKAALSETHHLRSFCLVPEDLDPGVGLGLVQGLRSHHHLTSWSHWTDDDPGTIVPELVLTLSAMPDLRSLALCIDEAWQADHFTQLARQLIRMPALENLHLTLAAGCDLSSFFNAPSTAGEAWPVASLTVDVAPASRAATRQTAVALIQGISTLPRLTSLCLSRHVFEAMPQDDLLPAIQQNGAIDRLTFLDAHGEDLPVDVSRDLAAALRSNRNRFDISSIGAMDTACSAFVNVLLATHSREPVSDIGIVLATHMVGRSTASDLRDCQGVLRVCKRVWETARDTRRLALLKLLSQPSISEADSKHKLHLTALGRKYGILFVEEALPLAELHSRWLQRESTILQ